jgi:hypothetical protein
MAGFVTAIIATTLKYAEARPDCVHEASQIVGLVNDKMVHI